MKLNYDKYIVAFSGGKDSLACVLHLLEQGVNKSDVELWHHDIDGREGAGFMDWPITPDYCRAVAKALGIPIYFSWKVNGFLGEMLRDDSLTQPTRWEQPNGTIGQTGGTRGKKSTRRKFPQVSADLKVRWCSAYLKIDVCSTAIRNQERFNNSRTLLISGERAEESAGRAKYATFEPDRADNRTGRTQRHVDRWRPVHKWAEQQVWDIIQRHKINSHPAYHLGWGRVSCMSCIFGSKHQWASLNQINPAKVKQIADYEQEFGFTINRSKSVPQLVSEGTPYPSINGEAVQALASKYTEPIVRDDWKLPAGAFGESCGPT
jgi:3'-phosphoadenosine 5'-phosphosulfate sulfotransferase (PAPS reductase)/FAD synthetase